MTKFVVCHNREHFKLPVVTSSPIKSLIINPRNLEGGQTEPPPSTLDTIHPIDTNIGKYNKIHLYFRLSEIT